MGDQVAAGIPYYSSQLNTKKPKGESRGGVAQLGEHLPCKQGVKGSNPSISIACIARIQDANLGSTASSVMALHANAFEFTTA